MIRSSRTWLPSALAALVFAALAVPAFAAAPNLEGNWKFMDMSNGGETTLALLKIEVKDGKPTVSILSSPLVKDLAVEGLKATDSTVSFEIKVPGGSAPVTLSIPKGDKKPMILRGTFQFGKRPTFAALERTDVKEISAKDARKQTPALLDLIKAFRTPPADQEPLLKEVLEKHGDTTAGYTAANQLLAKQVKDGAKDADLRAPIDVILKVAKAYGPAADKYAILSVAQTLTRAPKATPLAIEYARKAEKGLTKDDTARQSELVLQTLAWALRKNGKTDEAKEVGANLAKLTKQLDEEFERGSIPFKVEPVSRKGKSSRVALVELFTGAQCPPCVAADVAFDAAVKAYKPADVIFLEYHLHIPGPDPLTNNDTEGRVKFYAKEFQGTPTTFVNGKMTDGLGGAKEGGEESYGTLSKAINSALGDEEKGEIKLGVSRKGSKIEAEANVAGLKKTGEKVRLRFVLVEEAVHYPGSNDQRFHHHVVRAIPGGLEGFEMKEAKGSQKVLINLADVKKGLTEYLVEADKKRPFYDDDRPMALKHLKVVAFVQDDDSHEILQAAQIEVPDEK